MIILQASEQLLLFTERNRTTRTYTRQPFCKNKAFFAFQVLLERVDWISFINVTHKWKN